MIFFFPLINLFFLFWGRRKKKKRGENNKMKKTSKGVVEPPIPPPPAAPTDTTSSDLWTQYVASRKQSHADLTEFTHAKYKDWLHYFGFSVERELMWRSHLIDPQPNNNNKTTRTPSVSHTHVARDKASSDPIFDNTVDPLFEGAEEFARLHCFEAVDRHALAIVPDENKSSLTALAVALTEPFKQVRWSMTQTQCTNFKIRAVYRWMCEYITLVLSGAAASQPPPQSEPKSKATKGKPSPVEVNNIPSPSGSVMSPEQLLISRSGDPLVIATFFTEVLKIAGVKCEVIKGTLKGSLDALGKPTGFLPWAWNVVSIPLEPSVSGQNSQICLLVDVALSLCYVSMNAAQNKLTTSSPVPVATGGTPADLSIPDLSYSISKPTFAQPQDFSKHFQPFYFYCDVKKFLPLHYPEDSTHLYVNKMLSRTAWEVYPRLSHEFFLHQLRLDSHVRRLTFSVKAAPVYLSLKQLNPAHTELVGKVYRGFMNAQNQQLSLNEGNAVDSRFVWSNREEKSGRHTFTIMTPDTGNYTLVIGARTCHTKIATTDLPTSPFDVVVQYQFSVNFVPVNEAVVPRQLLSPSFMKLAEPQPFGKIQCGPQKFVIVPTTPRILAVAIVNRIFKPPTNTVAAPVVVVVPTSAPLDAGKKPPSSKGPIVAPPVPVKPPNAELTPEIERTELSLLCSCPERATFEGEMNLRVGLVEVWCLVGDPTSLCVGQRPPPPPSPTRVATPLVPEIDPKAVGGKRSNSPSSVPAVAVAALPLPATLVRGSFIPAIDGISVVKRVPPKELSIAQEGGSFVRPATDITRDRTPILRQLAGATADGLSWNEEGCRLIGQPLISVGEYFQSKK